MSLPKRKVQSHVVRLFLRFNNMELGSFDVWDFHYLMGSCFVAKLLMMIKSQGLVNLMEI